MKTNSHRMLNRYKSNDIDGIYDEMQEKIEYYMHKNRSEIGRDEAIVYKWLNDTLDDNFLGWHNFRSISERNIPHQNDFLVFNPKYGFIIIEVKSINSLSYVDEHIHQLRHQKLDLLCCINDERNKIFKKEYYVDGFLLYVGEKNKKNLIIDKGNKYNSSIFYFDINKSASDLCNEFYENHSIKNIKDNKNSNNEDMLYNGYIKHLQEKEYDNEKENFKEFVGYNDDDTIQCIIDNQKKVIGQTNEQKAAFELIINQNKKIILISGDAGTGKTYLAKMIAEKYINEKKYCTYIRWNVELGKLINKMIENKNEYFIECAYCDKRAKNSKPNLLIIDECQDYPNEAIEIMKQHIGNDYLEKVVLIYSEEQNNNKNCDFYSNFDCYSYRDILDITLYKNCRNSPEVRRIVENAKHDAEMKSLKINLVKDDEEAQNKIINKINEYLSKGIILENIRVISDISLPLIENKFNNIVIHGVNSFSGCEAHIVIFYDYNGMAKNDKVKLHRILTRAQCAIEYYQKSAI